MRTPHEILEHYQDRYREEERLSRGQGRLEFLRTMEILDRYLPPPPGRVLDVGGASGIYAIALAELGYELHLIDPVPRHVELARQVSGSASNPLASIARGDARQLPQAADSFDALLLLGPLYHLTESDDRARALGEAMRVLRSGGLVFAAGISRFASTFDGISRGFLREADFSEIVARDVREGQHRNPTERSEWFTTAFFHHPEGLREETVAVGFRDVTVFAVEGPGWVSHDLEEWLADAGVRHALMDSIRRVETEPSILGASPHLLAKGRKP